MNKFCPAVRVNPRYDIFKKSQPVGSILNHTSKGKIIHGKREQNNEVQSEDIQKSLENWEIEQPVIFSNWSQTELKEKLEKAERLGHYQPLNPVPKEFSKCIYHYKHAPLEEHDEFLKKHKNKMRSLNNFQKKSAREEERKFLRHREKALTHSTKA